MKSGREENRQAG
jgi:hypothetical protein